MSWIDPNPLADHLNRVETVEAAGVPAPEAWRALHGRLQDFLRLADQTPARDAVTAAVTNGAPDVPMLRCLALAEVANHGQVEAVHRHVSNTVLRHLLEAYDAPAAYAQLAAKFDAASKRFVTAAGLADPEADAASMLEQPDKVRRSWLDSEGFGNELSRLVDPLAAVAALAGVSDTDQDTIRIPLCVNVDGHHCRHLWTAWIKRDGRCNRWSALHQLGVEIRAASIDGGIEAYREPKKLEYRQQDIRDADGRVIGTRRIEFDPEDNPGGLPRIDPRRPGKAGAFV